VPGTPNTTSSFPRPRLRFTGSTGTSIHSGYLEDLEPNTNVKHEKWVGTYTAYGIAQEMIRDAMVKRGEDSIVDPLVAANWGFEPASSSELDVEIADFATWAFLECVPWHRVLSHLIRSYCRYGTAMMEMVEASANMPPSRFARHPNRTQGTAYVPANFLQIPIRTISRWHPKKSNPMQMRGIEQWQIGGDIGDTQERWISSKRLIRATWEQEGSDYTGHAVMRSAYFPWKTKKILTLVENMRHEKAHMGTPTLSLPEHETDEDTKAAAIEILQAIRANDKGYLLLPYGYEFSWSTTDGTTNIHETIERANRDILFPYASSFQMLGQSTSQNASYALGATLEGQYHLSLEKHGRHIEDVFTRGQDGWSPVERIIRLNYGDVEIPRLVARNMPTKNWVLTLPVFNDLAKTGLITRSPKTEEHLRLVMDIPQLEEGIDSTVVQEAVNVGL
jgi:hypothetical protein